MSCSPLHRDRYLFFVLFSITLMAMAGCKKLLDSHDGRQRPLATFDEAWGVIDQRYSLFAVKGIDWDSVKNAFRPRVKDDMDDAALFDLLADMLAVLKDGHLAITSQNDTAVYRGFYSSYPRNFSYSNVIDNYLQSNYQRIGQVIYKLQGNLAYIYYGSFDSDLSSLQFDSLINAVAPAKGLIIDVRSNGGGNSRNAALFFSRFITSAATVKFEVFKKGPGHADFFTPEPFMVTPAPVQYLKPVCVLVNRGCYSTCNDFVLYMSGLSQVRLLGDQSGGGGGIPNNYLLANGWKLQYTSSLTLSRDMQPVENGILPTVPVSISNTDEANGRDPILEKAIQLLQ